MKILKSGHKLRQGHKLVRLPYSFFQNFFLFFLTTFYILHSCQGGDTLSEKSVANGSHHYAVLLITRSVIAIYIVQRSESSKFVSGGFYFANKDL